MAKKNPDDLDKKEGCKETLPKRLFPDKRGEPGPEGTGVIAMIRRVYWAVVNFAWEVYDYFDLRYSRWSREGRVLHCWEEHGQHSEECKELEKELFPDGGGPSDPPD
jgi:hypothetical protein